MNDCRNTPDSTDSHDSKREGGKIKKSVLNKIIYEIGKAILKTCFAAESQISTPDGMKNIADIRVGDKIISLDGAGNKRIGIVIEVEPVRDERIVEVTFTNGAIWYTTATQWFYCGGDDYACVMDSGDKRALLEVGGTAAVESVTVTERVEKVYDFVVDGLNVMFINGIAAEGFSDD